MSNIVPFGQGQVPSYVASFFAADEESNIVTKMAIPALSFRGKAWRIVIDDQETLITNKDGDPSTTVSVVILDQIKKNSRVFYEGQYVSGEAKAPTCSSIDGTTPDASIAAPVAATCAACPNAVKGSKITPQGKATTLCSMTKRIAVIPASKPNFTALLMRLAVTSNWDKTTENEEWKAWSQYMDHLRASGVTNTVQVVTKIKFDHRAEFPKLLFKADRWTTPEELAVLSQRWKSDEVKDLLFGKLENAPGTDDGYDEAPAAAPATTAVAQPAAAAAPAAASAPTRTRAARPAAAKAATPEATPAAAAPAAVVQGADDGEDDGEFPDTAAPAQPTQAAQPAAAPAAAAVAAAPATANAGLSSLLGSWDD